jgi:hypothetical protein
VARSRMPIMDRCVDLELKVTDRRDGEARRTRARNPQVNLSFCE